MQDGLTRWVRFRSKFSQVRHLAIHNYDNYSERYERENEWKKKIHGLADNEHRNTGELDILAKLGNRSVDDILYSNLRLFNEWLGKHFFG